MLSSFTSVGKHLNMGPMKNEPEVLKKIRKEGVHASIIQRLNRNIQRRIHPILMGLALFCTISWFVSPGIAQEGAQPQKESLLKSQADEYNARIPKSVIELQQFRKTSFLPITGPSGQPGTATLINLNPLINTWFLLLIQWSGSESPESYHLQNPDPINQTLSLDSKYPHGILISTKEGTYGCELWSNPFSSELAKAFGSGEPYAPICGGKLFLRNKTQGNKTTLESVTDLLRNHVWQGEKITTFVRETFYKDAYLNTSEILEAKNHSGEARKRPSGAPAKPLMNPRYSNTFLVPEGLGIDLETDTGKRLLVGRWYSARGLPGVFVSVTQPGLVAEEVMQSQGKLVNPLDTVESAALVYMVAFDLDRFDLGFEMGTDHPRVGWSDRVQDQVRDDTLPGPDGIGTLEPLVMTGMVSPADAQRASASFVGGFKRYHGAFHWSDLALKNSGSHYGFMEHGVVLSKLQPDLATVVVFDDGTVDLKTWKKKNDEDLHRIRHARQNGVPIIDCDPATGTSRVGAFVARWGQGNWSGSAEKRFRTLRAGLGLHVFQDRRFLIYGYFSSVTPSAMARVFQAYHCRYALLLDINALEHTYLAVYKGRDPEFSVQHLIKGMEVLDKTKGGRVIPRFLGYPDNRDFFYLLRKADS
jgi:hypothetical protein